jgi:hypothetical protein
MRLVGLCEGCCLKSSSVVVLKSDMRGDPCESVAPVTISGAGGNGGAQSSHGAWVSGQLGWRRAKGCAAAGGGGSSMTCFGAQPLAPNGW